MLKKGRLVKTGRPFHIYAAILEKYLLVQVALN
jgi:hypothetical protein